MSIALVLAGTLVYCAPYWANKAMNEAAWNAPGRDAAILWGIAIALYIAKLF